ncbi:MAG: universal stress protein [Bacteroidales bacterium]|nr:universal stress protein [Bacteroidales bacterium]
MTNDFSSKEIILVPTDFSEVCEQTIDKAASLAQKMNKKLMILHVFDNKTIEMLNTLKKGEEFLVEIMSERVKQLIKQFSINADFTIRHGDIFEKIGDVATELEAFFIIMGTHGKVGLQQKLFGSRAMRVVDNSPVPILILQSNAPELEMKNILFPLNVNANVRQKVGWTAVFANIFNANVHIYRFYEKEGEINEQKQKVILKQITDYFHDFDVTTSDEIAPATGNFGDQILDCAHHVGAGMIVIMSTQNRFFNINFGEYDEKMIFNKYNIPVLLVNPKFSDTIQIGG